MQDIRCGHCNKKLGAGIYLHLQIKCPRCGGLNILKAASLEPERHRASDSGVSLYGQQSNHSLAGRQTPPG